MPERKTETCTWDEPVAGRVLKRDYRSGNYYVNKERAKRKRRYRAGDEVVAMTTRGTLVNVQVNQAHLDGSYQVEFVNGKVIRLPGSSLREPLPSRKATAKRHAPKLHYDGIEPLRQLELPRGKATLSWLATSGALNDLEDAIREDKVDVDEVDEEGWTALHHAASAGCCEKVRFLLKRMSDEINTQEKMQGYTPLHLATIAKHVSVVSALLSAGADPDIADKDGETPVMYLEPSSLNFGPRTDKLRQLFQDHSEGR